MKIVNALVRNNNITNNMYAQQTRTTYLLVLLCASLLMKITPAQTDTTLIFKDLARLTPIACLTTKVDDKDCILCLANTKGLTKQDDKNFYSSPDVFCYILSQFAGAWRIVEKVPVSNNEFIYSEFSNDVEIVDIKGKPYLYFTFRTSGMGNATNASTLVFALISPEAKKLTKLSYEGAGEYDGHGNLKRLRGNFIDLDEKRPPELLAFLQDKASKSPLVYRATAKDLALDNADNFDKKWEVENAAIRKAIESREDSIELVLRFTYYDNNLYKKDDSTTDRIENKEYVIASYFRSDVIGYDKTKNKFFPIIIDRCSHGCEKTLSWINEHTVKITYDINGETMVVELEKRLFQYFAARP